VTAAYHAPLIEVLKAMPSSQFRTSPHLAWTFLLADHDPLVAQCRPLEPAVLLLPLPHYVLAAFKRPPDPSAVESIDLSAVEPSLLGQLMPFQRAGVQYGVSRQGRLLLADDMGLGKTVQALALASYYRAAWPLLVVAPSSMRFAWEAAVRRWLPAVDPQDISVITTGKDFIGNSQVVILSYDLVKKKEAELVKKNYQLVILDESHMIKDAKSGRSKAVEPLAQNAKHLILLTGTPALSRPMELFSQVRALLPRLFRGAHEFGMRYCDGKMKTVFGGREVADFSGSSHMAELALLLQERCMVRRLKQEVLAQLPSKQRTMVLLDPAGVKSNSKEMKEKRKEAEKEGMKGMEARSSLLQWYAATATAKLQAVLEYLKDLLAADRKFLVFCHHQAMLKGVEEMLEKQGVGHIRIDGRVASEARKVLVDQFQTVDSVRVALLSITAANCGITLTAAHIVVFAELFWNPGVLCQVWRVCCAVVQCCARPRTGRTGSARQTAWSASTWWPGGAAPGSWGTALSRGTADDSLWPMIQRKLVVLARAGLSKDNFEDSEQRNLEMEKQKTIDDFYQSDVGRAEKEGEDVWSELCGDGEEWGELTDADLDLATCNADPQPRKKQKCDE
jgi:SWI/SNF-related matrix-associated actin-dependent regulator 1 of chromatin subfamily A